MRPRPRGVTLPAFSWVPAPDSGISVRFVEANGQRFELAECGSGDRLALCLHGFPELNFSWRHQMPLLAAKGWRVWAPNLRGYGASSRPEGIEAYRIDRLVEDVAALIDLSGAREVMLVAHDWGAIIAWVFAIRQLRPLARLVIMNVPHPKCAEREIRHWHQLKKSWYIFFFQLPGLPERLLAAQRPVIIAGREVAAGDAFAALARLAETLGAGVFHEPVPYNARFDVEHPAFLGDLTRRQETARALLEPFDLVVCVGADLLRMSVHSPVDPLPAGMPVVHLSNRDWELGKNHATEFAICADVPETLRALLPLLQERVTSGYADAAAGRLRELAERNWRTKAEAARQKVLVQERGIGIAAAFLMMTLADVLPREAIVVEEALTAAPALATFVPVHSPIGFYGLASGGLGFALPGAVGISLAHPGRPVVVAVGDGSALYGVQALWSAAQQQLPITYVVINNGGYRILQERLLARGRSRNLVGMELREPTIDWVAVAQGFGVAASRVSDPAALHDALRQAIASGRPALVDVIMEGPAAA